MSGSQGVGVEEETTTETGGIMIEVIRGQGRWMAEEYQYQCRSKRLHQHQHQEQKDHRESGR